MEYKNDSTLLIAIETIIDNNISIFKGQKVMTIENVAMIYEVVPEYLQEQVNKNIKRFPEDFIMRLTNKEQNALKTTYGCILTGKGILMAGGILKSKKAIKMHVQMIRYFVNLYKKKANITIGDKATELVLGVIKQLSK